MSKFKPGTPKPPNSGRRKGTKNKKTLLKADTVLAEADFNPTQKLIDLFPDLDPQLKLQALKLLLEYSDRKKDKSQNEAPQEPAADEDSTPPVPPTPENIAKLISIAKSKDPA